MPMPSCPWRLGSGADAMKRLDSIFLLCLVFTAADVIDTEEVAILTRGEKLGAYKDCFINENNELNCFFDEKEQNVQDIEQNVQKPKVLGQKT